ncbi:MAG: ABC transporter permease [Christensenellales bacterium]
MAKRLTKNLIFSVLALIAIFIVNFFLPRLMPGDPLGNLIGADDSTMSQEEYDALYHEMGLDKSLGEQFADYVKNLFQGKLGYSYHRGRDVSELLAEKIPRTLQITIPAWILSAVAAYFFGVIAGYKKSRFSDVAITGGMVLVDAIPSFLLAIVAVILFAFEWKILPSGALNSVFVADSAGARIADRIEHLILPVGTLAIAGTPNKYLLVRNSVASITDMPYIAYAKAKGLCATRIRHVHAFPNVSGAFISMLGTSFGHMIAGSIVIEKVFSIDGVGMLVNRAIYDKDFPTLQAALLVISLSVLISNFVADAICILADASQRRAK